MAARTDMPGCKGRMFEWWFRFQPDTQQYLWWHPGDHVSSSWRDSTHVIQERFDGGEVQDLLAQFTDPTELFGAETVDAARASGDVSAIAYARSGLASAGLDSEGRPQGVRLLHVGRDTPWGMVLRTRFWMGVGAPPGAVPVEAGLALMKHAYEEFHLLARFLPSLYSAENAEAELPW